ncbi:MAG: hypothetical protein ABI406_13790 [Ktedonobacteraceae bacterium]
MKAKNSWGTTQSSSTAMRGIVSLCMVIFVAISSVGLTFTLVTASTITAFAKTIPAKPVLTEYPTTDQPWGVSLDKHGHIWVAEPNCDASPVCGTPGPGLIARYNTANPASGAQNYIPPKEYNPVFLTEDASHNVWFTDPTHNAIGELVPTTNTWTEYTAPTPNAAPYDLLLDNNGNIWFTEILADQIGFFNPSTHAFAETATPSAGSAPYGITMNSRGNIWFAENGLPQIANFMPTSNGKGITIKEIAIDSGSGAPTPHLITTDSQGNIWYSEGFAGQVGVFNPVTKSHTDYPVSVGVTQTHISGIGVTSTGQVWFNDSLSARIGRLTPSTGKVFAIQLKFNGAHPHDGLTIDANNHVWITEQFGLNLGQIS